MSSAFPVYQVRAVNTDPDSENRMHSDGVAAEYGFRGGLVPGVTVYGYMTVPLVEYAPEWLRHGSMQVRFLEPFYDGDAVIVRGEVNGDGSIQVRAEREDGSVCGKATAVAKAATGAEPDLYAEHPLPEHRPVPCRDHLVPGGLLGTVVERLATAEPRALLHFSNAILMRNFELGPWIHAGSEITNWSATQAGEEISARGRIVDRFDRKGHEFVVVDVMLVASGSRLVQTVRHTAIYRPKPSKQ